MKNAGLRSAAYTYFCERNGYMLLKNETAQWGIAFLIVVISLFFMFPPEGYLWAKQISIYAIHWMLLCLLGGTIALFIGRERLLYTFYISSGIMAFFLMNSYNTELNINRFSSPDALNILFMNPTLGNQPLDRLLESSIKRNPDIMVIEEFTPDHSKQLAVLGDSYPHRYLFARIDPLGKAILSKFPLSSPKNEEVLGLPVISMFVTNPENDSFELMVVNHLPPITLIAYQKLNKFLDELAILMKMGYPNFILVADFNMVPWSRELRNFRHFSGLMASRKDNTIMSPSYKSMDFLNNFNLEIMYSRNLECAHTVIVNDSTGIPLGIMAKYQKKFVF